MTRACKELMAVEGTPF